MISVGLGGAIRSVTISASSCFNNIGIVVLQACYFLPY